MYFVPRVTKGGRFYKGTSPKSIKFLETYLIGLGLRVNADLRNRRETKLYREMVVPGFLNSTPGDPGAPARSLKASFGI
jgi:hypothetical protein